MNENETMKIECYWCGEFFDKKDIHRDHFLAKALGGGNNKNIVFSCYRCNHKKLNKVWGKLESGETIKGKKQARKFIKIIDKGKYHAIIISIIGIAPKKNKGGKIDLGFPKEVDYSEFGKEIIFPNPYSW